MRLPAPSGFPVSLSGEGCGGDQRQRKEIVRVKKVVSCLLLAAALCLSGCGAFLEREYSVVAPHTSTYYESENSSVLRAENYQDLVNDLLVLIGGHAEEGMIFYYGTEEMLPAADAAEKACREVQQQTPMGAYAVDYLTYTIDDEPRNYTAISLTLRYRRTAEQINSIVHATSVSALYDLLSAAARNGAEELVLRVGYFDNEEAAVRDTVQQVQRELGLTQEPWQVNFYPSGGPVGIIEILLKK